MMDSLPRLAMFIYIQTRKLLAPTMLFFMPIAKADRETIDSQKPQQLAIVSRKLHPKLANTLQDFATLRIFQGTGP